jgi:hypothetical protein
MLVEYLKAAGSTPRYIYEIDARVRREIEAATGEKHDG